MIKILPMIFGTVCLFVQIGIIIWAIVAIVRINKMERQLKQIEEELKKAEQLIQEGLPHEQIAEKKNVKE